MQGGHLMTYQQEVIIVLCMRRTPLLCRWVLPLGGRTIPQRVIVVFIRPVAVNFALYFTAIRIDQLNIT